MTKAHYYSNSTFLIHLNNILERLICCRFCFDFYCYAVTLWFCFNNNTLFFVEHMIACDVILPFEFFPAFHIWSYIRSSEWFCVQSNIVGRTYKVETCSKWSFDTVSRTFFPWISIAFGSWYSSTTE